MKKQSLYFAAMLAVGTMSWQGQMQAQTQVVQSPSQEKAQPRVAVPRTLEDYRALALQHNKSLQVAQMAVTKAEEEHRVARTNYLPKVSAVGLISTPATVFHSSPPSNKPVCPLWAHN